jgi:hypothetical protein
MRNMNDEWSINLPPKRSEEWKCFLFGSEDGSGITYIPPENCIPNWFVRWMMKVCLGCTWVKEKKQ